MEKQKLTKFISRYNLNSLVESVKYTTDAGTLKTSFISDDKSVLGTVTMKNFEAPDTEFGVYDTTKLLKMLSVLEDDINFSITEINGKGVALSMKDKSSAINYMLADLSVIPKAPDLKKLPDFNVNIKLDSNFISKFIRATGALSDEKNFTFVSKDGKSEIILGFASINTNRINIEVDATTDGDVNPISFSAQYLKEILAANRDATEATLDISSQGLSHVAFEVGDYSAQYFLVEVVI